MLIVDKMRERNRYFFRDFNECLKHFKPQKWFLIHADYFSELLALQKLMGQNLESNTRHRIEVVGFRESHARQQSRH
jgi:hypothetical protein